MPMTELLKTKNNQCSKEGVNRIYFKIADVTIALTSADPKLKLRIDGSMEKFVTSEKDPDVFIWAAWEKLEKETSGDKLFDSGDLWQLYYECGFYHFRFTSPASGPIPYKVARIRKDFNKGGVLLHRPYFDTDQPVYPLEYPLDELLINNFLLSGKGIEVHTSGVVDAQGNGHLFVGHSGAGKSTMAQLWQNEPDTKILSDDRIILRNSGERIWMYGTPWHGNAGFASPERAPLTRIYFLKKGQKNALHLKRKAEAVERLFTCSFSSFYRTEAIDFSLGFLGKIAKAVPCCELSFVPDKRVIDFIQKLEN
jgi:hypothetical protein